MEQIYLGIKVAKDSLVVATRLTGKVTTTLHNNDQKGIAGFLKVLPSQTGCIMEAEPQMQGLRSAGSACTAYSWLLPCRRKESSFPW